MTKMEKCAKTIFKDLKCEDCINFQQNSLIHCKLNIKSCAAFGCPKFTTEKVKISSKNS